MKMSQASKWMILLLEDICYDKLPYRYLLFEVDLEKQHDKLLYTLIRCLVKVEKTPRGMWGVLLLLLLFCNNIPQPTGAPEHLQSFRLHPVGVLLSPLGWYSCLPPFSASRYGNQGISDHWYLP